MHRASMLLLFFSALHTLSEAQRQKGICDHSRPASMARQAGFLPPRRRGFAPLAPRARRWPCPAAERPARGQRTPAWLVLPANAPGQPHGSHGADETAKAAADALLARCVPGGRYGPGGSGRRTPWPGVLHPCTTRSGCRPMRRRRSGLRRTAVPRPGSEGSTARPAARQRARPDGCAPFRLHVCWLGPCPRPSGSVRPGTLPGSPAAACVRPLRFTMDAWPLQQLEGRAR